MLFSSGLASLWDLEDDVVIQIHQSATFGKNKLMQFWFNTRFLEPVQSGGNGFCLSLQKSEIDSACKDKKHKIYPAGLAFQLEFD